MPNLRGSAPLAKRCSRKSVMRLAGWRARLASCFRADSERSILQAKIALHFVYRVDALFAAADALGDFDSEVVVLDLFEAPLDDLAEVIDLGAPGAGSQGIEAGLDLGFQSYRRRHSHRP